jgi:hypothetical protein
MSAKIVSLPFRPNQRRMNGRAYFWKWGRAYHIEGLDPDVICEVAQPAGLKHGPVESKRGGRITRDLVCLPPDETKKRRELSEAFLKQPVVHFAADEDTDR